MKKKFILICFITTIIIGSIVHAITVKTEPPADFINNLKTCTKSSFYENNTTISEYTIKGKLPNGRCEIYLTAYANYANNYVYNQYKEMMNTFSEMRGDNPQKINILSQAEMIQQAKKEKHTISCKLNNEEINALYAAYQKHNSKNPPDKISKDNIKFYFDTTNMGSFNNLLISYISGPCHSSYEKDKSFKRYACEYADATCYVTLYSDGTNRIKCNNEREQNFDFKITDKVIKHVKSGMCTLL